MKSGTFSNFLGFPSALQKLYLYFSILDNILGQSKKPHNSLGCFGGF